MKYVFVMLLTVACIKDTSTPQGEMNDLGGNQSLCAAVLNNDVNRALALIQNGADPNCLCEDRTPLMIAVEGRAYLDLIHALIDERASPFVQNTRGFNALMLAAWLGDYERFNVILILSPRLELDLQNVDGKTVLMIASENITSGEAMVDDLLTLHADSRIIDRLGKSAYEYAASDAIRAVYNKHGITN